MLVNKIKEFFKSIDILDIVLVVVTGLFVFGKIPVALQKDVKDIIEVSLGAGLVFKKLPPSFGPVLGSIIEKLISKEEPKNIDNVPPLQ